MTQPLPLSYVQQLQLYRHAAQRLVAAIGHHQSAKSRSDLARDALDDSRATLLRSGLPALRERCPNDEREAHIASVLAEQIQEARRARDELRAAESELEAARASERTERETLRTLQIVAESQAHAI